MDDSFDGACCDVVSWRSPKGTNSPYHLSQDFLWKSLADLVNVCFAALGFDTGDLGVDEFLDVAILYRRG